MIIDKANRSVILKGMDKPTSEQRSLYAKYLGSKKSERKAESCRKNGKRGGRPKNMSKM